MDEIQALADEMELPVQALKEIKELYEKALPFKEFLTEFKKLAEKDFESEVTSA